MPTRSEELEAWLRNQPREVSIAFAARAALRVLPVVQTATPDENVVLPVFRATAVSWAAARYQARETESGVMFDKRPSAVADATSAAAAIDAAFHANNATMGYTVAATVAMAARAPTAASRAAYFGGYGFGNFVSGFALGADPTADAFWSAVSVDATSIENGETASAVASSPLWPAPVTLPDGVPDRFRSMWQEMKAALLAANENWQVWTTLYEDRLRGSVQKAERELAYVRIDNDLMAGVPCQTIPRANAPFRSNGPSDSKMARICAQRG